MKGRRRTNRYSVGVAVGLSVGFHLIVIACAMPFRVPDAAQTPEPQAVELVTMALRRAPPTTEPVRQQIVEPVTEESRPTPRLLLASTSLPRVNDMTPTVIVEPEPAPEPPITPEPAPVKQLEINVESIARKQVILETLPPRTEEERVKARVEGFLRAALPPLPNDESPMPDLRPDGHGNLIHEDGAFVATIAPDGSVTFGTRGGAKVEGFTPGKNEDPSTRDIMDLFTRVPGIPLTPFKGLASDRRVGDGYDSAPEDNADNVRLGFGIRPNTDLNDLMLKAAGDNPLAAKERRFLRLTEELRDNLGDQAAARNLKQSKLRASRHLEALWANESMSFATKRQVLFDLWDECEEPSTADDQRPEAKAGLKARKMIIGFIRNKIPRGSPEGYGQAELERLNRKRSSSKSFSPY